MAHVAKCPLCGCVHNVPFFEGKESEAVRCINCSAYFHYTARKAGGDFGTRLADRMTERTEP